MITNVLGGFGHELLPNIAAMHAANMCSCEKGGYAEAFAFVKLHI